MVDRKYIANLFAAFAKNKKKGFTIWGISIRRSLRWMFLGKYGLARICYLLKCAN